MLFSQTSNISTSKYPFNILDIHCINQISVLNHQILKYQISLYQISSNVSFLCTQFANCDKYKGTEYFIQQQPTSTKLPI